MQEHVQERTDRRERFVREMLVRNGHDPDDLISDAGHTVLDGWMEKLRLRRSVYASS